MKKAVTVISIISVIIVLVSVVGLYLHNKNTVYNITVTESFWNEYGEQYHNKELNLNIKLNDKITVNGGLGDELTFTVIKVSHNSITIKASENMSQMKTDLLSMNDEFVIRTNEETILNRLVTDMGVSYTIKLEQAEY